MSDWIRNHRTLAIALGCAGLVSAAAAFWYLRREPAESILKKEAHNNKEMVDRLKCIAIP